MSGIMLSRWSHEMDPTLQPDSYNGPGVHHNVRLASGGWRLAAAFVDYIVPLMPAWWLIYGVDTVNGFMASMALEAIPVFVVWNSVIVQGNTGQSLGKRIFGLRLYVGRIDVLTGRFRAIVPGWFNCAGRLVVHLCDFFFLLGFWHMFTSDRRQSFGDAFVGTFVSRSAKLPILEPWTYDGWVTSVRDNNRNGR